MTYILSNIKCRKTVPNLKPEDELVFINNATNYELFKDAPCRKVLFCATQLFDNNLEFNAGKFPVEDFKNPKKRLYFTRDEWYGKEMELFDDFDIIINLDHHFGTYFYPQFRYPNTKHPTTGFILYNFYKYLYGIDQVNLINFFPMTDFTTGRWFQHDFEYEQTVLNEDGVVVIDLR